MLTIRLSRQGRKNTPHFRLVVQEKTVSPKSGKYVAIIGHYDPTEADNKLTFEQDKLEIYLKNGATPSDTVARLLLKAGVKGLEKFVAKYTKQKARKAEEKKEEAPAAAPAKEADKSAEDSKSDDKPEKADVKEEKSEEKKAEQKSEDKPAKAEEAAKEEEQPAEEKKD